LVKAQDRIADGAVREVTFLSGPRIFYAAVRTAMLQYKCSREAGEVVATQDFSFKLQP
jgi:protein TonB